MTSPLLRLFAVFWWLVVIGSVGFAVMGVGFVWKDYYRSYPAPPAGFVLDNPPDPINPIAWSVAILVVSLLPFGIMTLTRWIITSRWRLGPRW